MGNAIGGAFNSVFQSGYNVAKGMKQGLTSGLSGVGSTVWGIVNNIGSTVWHQLAASSIGAGRSAAKSGTASAPACPVSPGRSGRSSAASAGTSGKASNTVFNWGWSMGRKIWDGFIAGLSGIASAIINAIKSPINAVISAWNNLRIGGFTINLPVADPRHSLRRHRPAEPPLPRAGRHRHRPDAGDDRRGRPRDGARRSAPAARRSRSASSSATRSSAAWSAPRSSPKTTAPPRHCSRGSADGADDHGHARAGQGRRTHRHGRPDRRHLHARAAPARPATSQASAVTSTQPVQAAEVIARDYEVPLNLPVVYTATTYDAAGTVLETVRRPGVHGRLAALRIVARRPRPPDEQPAARRSRASPLLTSTFANGVHRVLDRRAPVVTTLPAYTPAGELDLLTDTLEQRDLVRAILGNGYPVLLRTVARTSASATCTSPSPASPRSGS